MPDVDVDVDGAGGLVDELVAFGLRPIRASIAARCSSVLSSQAFRPAAWSRVRVSSDGLRVPPAVSERTALLGGIVADLRLFEGPSGLARTVPVPGGAPRTGV